MSSEMSTSSLNDSDYDDSTLTALYSMYTTDSSDIYLRSLMPTIATTGLTTSLLPELSGVSQVDSTPIQLSIPYGAALLGFGCAVLISLVGITGNLITMAALTRHSARLNSNATTRFVINLAFIDFLFCSLVMPITAGRYLTQRWPFGSLLCRLYPFFYYGTVATSLMLITIITANRLVLIAFNNSYRRIYTNRNVHLMVLFCWAFSFSVMSIPLSEIWGRFGYQPKTFSCTVLRDTAGRSPKKFLFTLGFLLPMSAIVVCYGIIFAHVRQQSAMIKSTFLSRAPMVKSAGLDSHSTGSPGATKFANKTSKRDLRLTFLISVVFGTFLLCFLPLFIGNVFVPEDRYPYFHVMASCCAWLNSCINPFIYFAMNPRYRAAFKQLFCIQTLYKVNGQGSSGGGGGAAGAATVSVCTSDGPNPGTATQTITIDQSKWSKSSCSSTTSASSTSRARATIPTGGGGADCKESTNCNNNDNSIL